jgi:hypothetical protein
VVSDREEPSLTSASGGFFMPAELSISTSFPRGTPPPGRDPGAKAVAGSENRKQDSCVNQHRISTPLAFQGES